MLLRALLPVPFPHTYTFGSLSSHFPALQVVSTAIVSVTVEEPHKKSRHAQGTSHAGRCGPLFYVLM